MNEPTTEAGRALVAYLREQADADTDKYQAPQAKSAYLGAARTVELALVRIEHEAAARAAEDKHGTP